jgi:deazaflavin-dependent oxidoreductase (nitroreductase family)
VTGEPQFLYLATRGRRTGAWREIEIWFTRHDGRYYVVAELVHAQWVRNVEADPLVSVRVGEETFGARARIVPVAAEPRLVETVQQRSREKYGWGDGLVVELTPLAG